MSRFTADCSRCCGLCCHGAGQWITQVLFNGARWQDCAATARAMSVAWQLWLPRFKAAANGTPADAVALHRDTIALIRSLLHR
jgi:hypothetical protein